MFMGVLYEDIKIFYSDVNYLEHCYISLFRLR
jgi:hypothetical protein